MRETSRSQKWRLAVETVGAYVPTFAVVVIQGLGCLDAQLRADEDEMRPKLDSMPAAPGIADWLRHKELLDAHMGLAYLWVLGGYEVIRTIDQRDRKGGVKLDPLAQAKVRATKRRFERVRMPLAKMEAGRNFPGDAPFPTRTFGPNGFAWEVTPGVVIGRGELADLLLEALLAIGPRSTTAAI